MVLSLAYVGGYVLLVGIAAFLEKALAGTLPPFQLNLAVRTGSLLLAIPAVLIADNLSLPSAPAALAGYGIGLLAGTGTASYFVALRHFPVWLVVCLADAYIFVTAILSITVLGETVTIERLFGFVLTLAGVVLLSYPGNQTHTDGSAPPPPRLRHIILVAPYIVLVGVSAFLEKPALRHLDALQLNALIALGMSTIAIPTAYPLNRGLPFRPPSLQGIGIGLMIGLGMLSYYVGLTHLPVSVAATVANTYVLVTVALSIVVWQEAVTAVKIGGTLAILGGVAFLTV